jgi:hypothetical protein
VVSIVFEPVRKQPSSEILAARDDSEQHRVPPKKVRPRLFYKARDRTCSGDSVEKCASFCGALARMVGDVIGNANERCPGVDPKNGKIVAGRGCQSPKQSFLVVCSPGLVEISDVVNGSRRGKHGPDSATVSAPHGLLACMISGHTKTLSVGTKLGPYETVAPIGAVGMGEVYRAHDSRLNRDVAIIVSNKEFRALYPRSARACRAQSHQHLPSLRRRSERSGHGVRRRFRTAGSAGFR